MATSKIEVTGEIELHYDETSPEFQEALSSWNEVISDGDANDMLLYVAGHLQTWGDHTNMIEGVGYVCLVGQEVPKEPFSGIRVTNEYAEREYYIND